MARPKSEGETRDCPLQVLVTRTELLSVLSRVPATESVSNYLRRLILEQTAGTAQPPFLPAEPPE